MIECLPQKITHFIENYLNIDESDVLTYTYTIKQKCLYFEAFDNIILKLESKFNQLEKDNSTVEKLQKHAAKIEELLSSGNS